MNQAKTGRIRRWMMSKGKTWKIRYQKIGLSESTVRKLLKGEPVSPNTIRWVISRSDGYLTDEDFTIGREQGARRIYRRFSASFTVNT